MQLIDGLPDSVSIAAQDLRGELYAVLCLPCGGGGAPAAVETCDGEWARSNAVVAAQLHAAEHERRRDAAVNAELHRQQAAALGWSQAQADVMLWADRGHLHFDGAVYYRKDMDDPRAGRGRTVARKRVQALTDAGFLAIATDGRSVLPTADGHAARRAWIAAGAHPAEQEANTLRPLIGGQTEARLRAETAAYLAQRQAERDELSELAARFAPEPQPEAEPDPLTCDHDAYVWLYLTAHRISGALGYHMACACGQGTNHYPGASPAMNTGTATRSLGIADADTQTAEYHADRCGYEAAGPWTVLDERTKRVRAVPVTERRWPRAGDTPLPTRNNVTDASVTHSAAVDPQPAQETVTTPPVTQSRVEEPADSAAVDVDVFAAVLAEQRAAWEAAKRANPHYGETVQEAAAEYGVLPIAGPGIVGPGTQVEYLPGCRPGPRVRHARGGVLVTIGRTSATWRPYGGTRTVRTPLDRMRAVPLSSDHTAPGADHWSTWSLADHLTYARPTSTNTRRARSAEARAEARAEQLQLPLFDTVADVVALADRRTETVTGPGVTQTAGPLVIIPCSGAKLPHPAPAGELYTGTLHAMCRSAADALTAAGGTVLVLSAKHGFLTLDQVTEPYDLRMHEAGAVTADQLREQAHRMGIARTKDVTVLAGGAYAAAARAVWPQASVPLAGSRGIGVMRHRLAHITKTHTAQAA